MAIAVDAVFAFAIAFILAFCPLSSLLCPLSFVHIHETQIYSCKLSKILKDALDKLSELSEPSELLADTDAAYMALL